MTIIKRADLVTKGMNDFEKRVAMIRKRDDCSGTEALQKARFEHPDEFGRYQLEGIEKGARALHEVDPKVRAKAIRQFEAKISEIASKKQIGRAAAMRRARQEYPYLFDAYQLVS